MLEFICRRLAGKYLAKLESRRRVRSECDLNHLLGGLRADNDIMFERALSGPHTLAVGLAWWLFGMALAVSYVVFVYSRFKGKVEVGGH